MLGNAPVIAQKAPFSPTELVFSCASAIACNATTKNLDVTVLCDDNVPELVLGDSRRLAQILHNFANNSVKFTDEGVPPFHLFIT